MAPTLSKLDRELLPSSILDNFILSIKKTNLFIFNEGYFSKELLPFNPTKDNSLYC